MCFPDIEGAGIDGAGERRPSRELRAFSSEVDTGSREENASKQESRASVLIQSKPNMLQAESRKCPDFVSDPFALQDANETTVHLDLSRLWPPSQRDDANRRLPVLL